MYDGKFRLKACPKCYGDLSLESDSYGAFEKCLQCGLSRDLGPTILTTALAAYGHATARRVSG